MEQPGPKPSAFDPSQFAAAAPQGVKSDTDTDSDARAKVFEIRAAWMRKMGFTEEEIAAACVNDGSPVDLADEIEQLKYADKLKEITPPASVLSSVAVKR
jgi:hypothetical protein